MYERGKTFPHTKNSHSLLTKYRAGYKCREPSNIAEGRGVERVDTSQFKHPSCARQRSNVVHPPQDQLAIDGVWIMECPCSCITHLLPANGKMRLLKLFDAEDINTITDSMLVSQTSMAFQQFDPPILSYPAFPLNYTCEVPLVGGM